MRERITCKLQALLFFFLLANTTLFGQEKVTLRYIGSSTVANYILAAEPVYGKVKFEVDTEPESAGGEQAILEGRCDIAGVAKVPRTDILAKGIISTLIGWDAIAVITHPDNPVKNLTQDQLKGIFSGEINNWKEIGGEDLAIHSYTVGNESATRKVFRSIILGELDYGGNEVVKPDKDIISKVMNDPAGIGHISFSFLKPTDPVTRLSVEGSVPDVNNPSYPIKRPLYLLWWPGRSGVSGFVNWTLDEPGQSIVKRNFVGVSQGKVQSGSGNGALIVYTQTSAVEDGGVFFYPHKPYELLYPDRTPLKRVSNHRNINDEIPEKVPLEPGTYIILPEMEDGSTQEFFVTVEPGKTTSIDIEALLNAGGKIPVRGKPGKDPREKKEQGLAFSGDFRFRGEHDWNSRQFDGTLRKDRSRFRYRLRLEFSYKWNDIFTIGGRLRTGVATNMQSPHLNVGYIGFTSLPFQLDRAYISGKYKTLWWWAGKNGLPFWKQNELWWDDDVSPEGLAAGLNLEAGKLRFKPTAAFFIANHDHNGNIVDGKIYAGQLAAEYNTGRFGLNLASGFFWFDDIYNVPETDNLFTGTRYKLDYQILNSGLKLTRKGRFPVSLGFDYMVNFSDYSTDTLMNEVYKDQKTGFVASLLVGSLKDKGDWLIGYYFARKEELSVVSYYGEDDWVRWGNINRNRNTNYVGHEIRLGYSFAPRFNAVLRAYTVRGLVTPALALESGDRVRLDFNLKF